MTGSTGSAPVAIAILCGGQSRRMGGRPKAALRLQGITVLDRILTITNDLTGKLAIDGLATVLIGAHESLNEDPALTRLLEATGLPVVRDRTADAGPLAGLEAAFDGTNADRILLLACDMPWLSAEFLQWLLAQADIHGSIAPVDTAGQLHPLCAVYDRACRARLAQNLEQRHLRVQTFARDIGLVGVPAQSWAGFDPAGQLLMNLNDPAQFETAARACRSPSE